MRQRNVVHTAGAPAAIGPYSQATVAAGLVFCSGQIAIDPTTGQLVLGDIRVQTERVMQNLQAVLQAANTDFSAVVKSTIFLRNMADFITVNEIYGRYFAEAPPARSTVAVAGLPRDALVEIEMIALSTTTQ